MANKKISQLAFLDPTTVSIFDYFPIVDESTVNPSERNKRITLESIKQKIESEGPAFITGKGTAGANISEGRAVMFKSGLLYHYNPEDISNYGAYVGISTAAVLAGSEVTFVTSGILAKAIYNFTENDVLYSSSTGEITNITPSTGIHHEIGYAKQASGIVLRNGQPKLLTAAVQEYTLAEKNKLSELSSLRKAPVQSQAVLKSIPQSQCVDQEDRLVENDNSYYRYDAHSGGGTGQLAPNDQTGGLGFWIPVKHLGGHTADEITESLTRVFVTPAEKAKINLDYGYQPNPTALSTAHPTGVDGAFVRIGSTDTIWVWDSGTNSWVNSGNSITGYVHPNHYGHVASVADGPTTIQPGVITYAMLAAALIAASGEVSASKLILANDSRLHAPNTDTGTNATYWFLGSPNTGIRIAGGLLQKTVNGGTTWTNVEDTTTTNKAFDPLQDGPTINWDILTGSNKTVTLGGNRTLAIQNIASGDKGVLKITQDVTGSRTLTLPAGSKVINGGAGGITLTATAGAVDVISFTYDGTNYLWNYGPNYN